MEHAVAARTRMAEQIASLEVEDHDLGVEAARAAAERGAAADALDRARSSMEGLRVDRAARESELVGARSERDGRATELRTREHDLRLLARGGWPPQELDARVHGDGARTILANRPRTSGMGSVADYSRSTATRAVEASRANRSSTSSCPRTPTPRQACGSPAIATPDASASSSRTVS
jgi:hypothetical protein